ncbi:protein FAM171B-like [Lampris incognitus]|uniref:protein FAM171B-like n=1 Tax=Lampris incognitus TaxID=2546036 RepID=UPI0024B53B6F|nr:protein FAM171B-like [Lampris incognitus]
MGRLTFLRAALWVLLQSGLSPAGQAAHFNEGNFSQQHQDHQTASVSVPGSTFTLKVQVNDALSRQYLSQATVEVYVNYTKTNTALTGENGDVLLQVPGQIGLPVTIIASRDGYVVKPLPWKTNRVPVFSSITMSLLGLNQGNIWLYEDSVLINSKTSDAPVQPTIQFPKRLLNLSDSSDISSIKALLTIPKLSKEDDNFLNTLGLISSKSGYTSVELSPMAAVSVQLFSAEVELHVSGPIQITLPLPDNSGLRPSNAVPAWCFNHMTGGWMRKGLGMVVLLKGKLMWTYNAPHLGYWIAAPISSSSSSMDIAVTTDFILYHSSFLMVILGTTLVILFFLLILMVCHRRSSLTESRGKRIHASKQPVLRKDQTTSTYDNELLEVSSGDCHHLEDGLNQTLTERGANQHNDNIANPEAAGFGLIAFEEKAAAIRVKCTEPELRTDPNNLTSSHKISQQMRIPESLNENLFFFNHPVAIVHAPAFFHAEEQPETPQWSKAATLPRAGVSNNPPTDPVNKESFTQTKDPLVSQSQAPNGGEQLGVPQDSHSPSSISLSRGHYSFPESMSVPGTLNKIGDNRRPCSGPLPSELQGNSDHTLAELSKIPSPLPPRAWFVSLEGKPAAEIHHAITEQQRRRRPAESRDTSLDSGVDMNELNQTAGRRAVTLERKATFVKSAPGSRPAPTQ